MSRPNITLIAIICLCVGACSESPDTLVEHPRDSAAMDAAIAKARYTLSEFWQVFENPQQGETDFALKLPITEGDEVEYFWLTDIERTDDGRIFGLVGNEPGFVTTVAFGDRLKIPEADISDWMYMRGGKMHGNHTLRPLLGQMDPEEAASLRAILAD